MKLSTTVASIVVLSLLSPAIAKGKNKKNGKSEDNFSANQFLYEQPLIVPLGQSDLIVPLGQSDLIVPLGQSERKKRPKQKKVYNIGSPNDQASIYNQQILSTVNMMQTKPTKKIAPPKKETVLSKDHFNYGQVSLKTDVKKKNRPRRKLPKEHITYPTDVTVLPNKRVSKKKGNINKKGTKTSETFHTEVAPGIVDLTSTPCSETLHTEVAPVSVDPATASDDCLEDELDNYTTSPGPEPTEENVSNPNDIAEEQLPGFDHPTGGSSEEIAALPAPAAEDKTDSVVSTGFKLTISALSGLAIMFAI
jgi:hypothetical protein